MWTQGWWNHTPAANPEDAIQIILSRQLHQPFTVISIVPITDKNKVVLGYTVLVSRKAVTSDAKSSDK